MHERTQRRVSRLAFIILCLIPTIVVGAVCIISHTPYPAKYWELRLTNALGLPVTVGHAAWPSPRLLKLADVRLSTASSTGTQVYLDQVYVKPHDELLLLRIGEARVSHSNQHATIALVGELMASLDRVLQRPARIELDTVSLIGTEHQQTFSDWRATVGRQEDEITVMAAGRPAAKSTEAQGERASMRFEYTGGQLQVSTGGYEVDTAIWLPTSGAKSRFRGQLQCDLADGRLIRLSVNGQFRQTSIALPAVTGHMHLSADIDIDQFEAMGGVIQHCQGRLRSRDAVLPNALLQQMIRQGVVRAGPAWKPSKSAEATAETSTNATVLSPLEFAFWLDERGMATRGLVDPADSTVGLGPAGVVLRGSEQWIAPENLLISLLNTNNDAERQLARRWQHYLPRPDPARFRK